MTPLQRPRARGMLIPALIGALGVLSVYGWYTRVISGLASIEPDEFLDLRVYRDAIVHFKMAAEFY
jgi:hypothetical protein